MLFKEFAGFLQKLEKISSRNEITEQLAIQLAALNIEEVAPALYMMTGRIAPAYDSLEFNFSAKSILKSLDEKYEPELLYARLGDIGIVLSEYQSKVAIEIKNNDGAGKGSDSDGDSGKDEDSGKDKDKGGDRDKDKESGKDKHKPKPKHKINSELSLVQVYNLLHELAAISGSGAVQHKVEIFQSILQQTDPISAWAIGKIITGKIRLGVNTKTIIDAISWAKTGSKELKKELGRAYGLRSDIGELALAVLKKDESPALITIKPGIPLASQLVEREVDAGSILKRMGKAAIVQAKYDGLRAQLHIFNSEKDIRQIRVFSRNLEPLTDSFPELGGLLLGEDVESIILDGEIIGFDSNTGDFLPFQQTIQRKRKYGISQKVTEIPVNYFIFDILYLDSRDLTKLPLQERLRILNDLHEGWSVGTKERIKITESPLISDPEQLNNHFRELLAAGLEGVIVKDPESIYNPGKRGYDWIKLKANTHSDLKDTVDCVIMGYYFGRGARAQTGIGGVLVGIYDGDLDEYQTIAKVGSGFKQAEWSELKEKLDAISQINLPENYRIAKDLIPDVVVLPDYVIEVDADEVTLSSKHTAGASLYDTGQIGDDISQPEYRNSIEQQSLFTKGEEELGAQGYSLRFPRYKRWRSDKNAQQTTSIKEIVRLYSLKKK